MKPVELHASFEAILGKDQTEYTEEERQVRWDEWLKLAPNGAVGYWTDASDCRGCIHLVGYWCSLAGLPCTVNPILSFREGMLGMACMGAGKELVQESLFEA